MCLQKNKPYGDEARKMRKTIREHKKELLPALTRKYKMVYYFSMYAPFTYRLMIKLRKKLNKKGNKVAF